MDRAEDGKQWPIDEPQVSVNKETLEHSQSYHLHIVHGCFCASAELNSCAGDHMAQKS